MANINNAKNDLEKWRIKECDNFSKRVTKASKLASVALQKDINRLVKEPTNFTKNAVGFYFNVGKFQTKNNIYIKDAQANYLGHLIDDESPIDKFVPVSDKFVNKFGNIPGLKNMRNLVAVTHGDKTWLIKKGAKKKQVIAIFKKGQKRKKTLGSWNEICKRIETQVDQAVKNSLTQ